MNGFIFVMFFIIAVLITGVILAILFAVKSISTNVKNKKSSQHIAPTGNYYSKANITKRAVPEDPNDPQINRFDYLKSLVWKRDRPGLSGIIEKYKDDEDEVEFYSHGKKCLKMLDIYEAIVPFIRINPGVTQSAVIQAYPLYNPELIDDVIVQLENRGIIQRDRSEDSYALRLK